MAEAKSNLTPTLEDVQKKIDDMLKAAEEKAKEIISGAEQSVKETKTGKAAQNKDIREREKTLQELVTVRLFKDNKNYKDDVFVAVNGKAFQIRRGVEVQVPRYVKEVLDNSMKQDEAAAEYIEAKEKEYEQESLKYN